VFKRYRRILIPALVIAVAATVGVAGFAAGHFSIFTAREGTANVMIYGSIGVEPATVGLGDLYRTDNRTVNFKITNLSDRDTVTISGSANSTPVVSAINWGSIEGATLAPGEFVEGDVVFTISPSSPHGAQPFTIQVTGTAE
jgi:hypothetical protein